ncbi:putative glycosyltransferase EpsJ [Proteus vulgaris]|nr:putative glycosyltransferase EpsJ [Proteus vulgaris]
MNYSIIIPAYNIENYIDKLGNFIKNIKNIRKDVEFIIINDGSTDNTKLKLNALSKEIRYLEQENKGVSSARNLGLQTATGNWVLFLDADDEFSLKIFDTLDLINDKKELILFNYKINTSIVNKNLASGVYKNLFLLNKFLTKKNNFSICCLCYKKDFLLKNNLFFKDGYQLGEDIHFLLRALLLSTEINYINNVLFIYNLHTGSAVNSKITHNKLLILNLYNTLDNLFIDINKEEYFNFIYFKSWTYLYLIKKNNSIWFG